MYIFKEISSLQHYLAGRRKTASIGFVPTMGALHKGHVSLIEKAKSQNSICVCSIFVNPTQFNDKEDLKKYPRTIEQDIEILYAAGNHVLLLPETEEIYPEGETKQVNYKFDGLDTILEGISRPGHFAGVAQVVSRLLEIVQPHTLYLGQKDYQQFLIVKKMLEQIDSPVRLIMSPIIREPDGLAMSSRNVRLTEEERKEAGIISRILFEVKEKSKQFSISDLKKLAVQNIQSVASAQTDYFEIADAENLQAIQDWKDARHAIAITAVKFGKVRLLDNILL